MTNTELFRNKVKEIGVTYTFIASKLGITGEAPYNKINNETKKPLKLQLAQGFCS